MAGTWRQPRHRAVTTYLDTAMEEHPVAVEISNPTGPRTRLTLSYLEALNLKNSLATLLKGARYD